ncbi:MAG: alpha/beta hydrolase [Candidatus Acidiferrales bacterium]
MTSSRTGCARFIALFLFCFGVHTRQSAAQSASIENHQDASAEPRTFPLWEGRAPGALGEADEDRPTITVYQPSDDHAPAPAVIVFPGGSYTGLATNHEGRQAANWLNACGMVAFVVKYRVGPKYHDPIELGDAQRAIRWVRSRAAELHVTSTKIGVMGFSAGGHLASTTETHFDGGDPNAADRIDRASSRPDFAILAYPVISFVADYAHRYSWENLLGKDATPEMRRALSNEFNVTPQTPPTFLFSSSTDMTVPPENSVVFYRALLKAKVPAELHIFQTAPHGVGLDLDDPAVGEWSTLLLNWLRANRFLPNAD